MVAVLNRYWNKICFKAYLIDYIWDYQKNLKVVVTICLIKESNCYVLTFIHYTISIRETTKGNTVITTESHRQWSSEYFLCWSSLTVPSVNFVDC